MDYFDFPRKLRGRSYKAAKYLQCFWSYERKKSLEELEAMGEAGLTDEPSRFVDEREAELEDWFMDLEDALAEDELADMLDELDLAEDDLADVRDLAEGDLADALDELMDMD